jgi:hypothetical protein
VLTRARLIGMGAGMCCLSWANPRTTRLLAALAAARGLHMHPHSLMLLTGVQAL